MKTEILQIADDLRNGVIDTETAQTLLLGLFSVSPCLYGVTNPNEYLEFFWDKEKAEKSLVKYQKNSYGQRIWVEEVEVTK